MSTIDNAKENRMAIMVCIFLIYVLYQISYLPYLFVQSDVSINFNYFTIIRNNPCREINFIPFFYFLCLFHLNNKIIMNWKAILMDF